MTNKEYHAHSAISKSDIDLFLKSPKLFKIKKDGLSKSEGSSALILGSVTHKLTLERDDFSSEYLVEPNADKRTKDGKAEFADFYAKYADDEREYVPFDIYEQALKMSDAVLANATAQKFLKDGFAERSFFSSYDGLEIKCRPDYYNEKLGLVCDLKTSSNASASEFSKSVGNFNYHIQAALYSDILRANGLKVNNFLFIVVEKTAPHFVGFYELSENAINFGQECYQNALNKIKLMRQNNLEFPEYAEIKINENGQIEQKIIQTIDLPMWRYNKGE